MLGKVIIAQKRNAFAGRTHYSMNSVPLKQSINFKDPNLDFLKIRAKQDLNNSCAGHMLLSFVIG